MLLNDRHLRVAQLDVMYRSLWRTPSTASVTRTTPPDPELTGT